MIYRAAVVLIFAVMLMLPAAAQESTPVPPDVWITVPDGFHIDVYARPQDAESPAVIAFGPDQRLYLLTSLGKLYRLDDSDSDHYAETQTALFLNENNLLNHSVGLAWHEGEMYLSDSGRISTFADADGDGMLDTLTPIVQGLVSLKYWGHSNNGIAFGPDGKLYVPIGSTTDHGPIQERMEALILRMNPDGSDMEVFARGFRNAYDLAFAPDGALFAADNNPDRFDRTLRYLPSEELNHVREGQFYGFPDVFGDPPAGDSSAAPVTTFFPSVASAGITYYAADHFPPTHRNGVYIAQWGSVARPVQARDIRNGYMVVFVPLTPTADGTYTGDWQVFALFNQEYGEHRPVDVTVGPDGVLYILEYLSATVYRVTYGDAPVTMPTAAPTQMIDAEIALGESIYHNGANGAPACVTCHTLDESSAGLGPSLVDIETVADERIVESIEVYIEESIIEPNEYVVEGYPAGIMYQEYAARLTDVQIEAVAAYVLSLDESE